MVRVALIALMAGCGRHPALEPPPGYDEVRDTLLANGEFRHFPAIDPSGRWLVYARNSLRGVEYSLMDLSDKSVQVLVTNAPGNYQASVADLFAWSPDGRWLALVEPMELGESWTVKVRNMDRGTVAETGLRLALQDIEWLGPESFGVRYGDYLLVVERTDDGWRPNYGKRFNLTAEANAAARKLVPKPPRLTGIDWKTLVHTEPGKVAFGLEGNIWEVDMASGQVDALTDWPKGKTKWLDYSTTHQAFLFCAPNPSKPANLGLMRWDRKSDKETPPTCLTSPKVNALKGCWLADGYAYVSDHPDRSQLIIVRDDEATTTVFEQGSIWSYEPGARGKQLAAIASEAMEPMGLWQIDPVSGRANQVLAAEQYSPAIDRRAIVTHEGKRLDYTVFKPGNRQPPQPYPALFLSPYGDRTWAELSRVLPRLNMLQVVPSVSETSAKSEMTRAEDLRLILSDVLRNYPVDTNRIYLEGLSAATKLLPEIIATNPGAFRGVILDSPVAGGLPDVDFFLREGLEMQVTIGTEDVLYNEAEEYVKAARKRGVTASLAAIQGMAHGAHTSEQFEQRVRATVSFIHRSAASQDGSR